MIIQYNKLPSQLSNLEETKEPQPSTRTCTQRKRKISPELHHDLKLVKKMVESSNKKNEEKAPIYYKSQRRYTMEAKTKALELTEKLGRHRVSIQTGIPEATIRRWKKVGIVRESGKHI